MAETDRLDGCIEWIDLSFVERERTPSWAIQVGIRCHLAGMSTRDASKYLEKLGVHRSHVAVHNWVQKAELQPISTVSADQLAVDEKMIRLHGEEFWLYGAVDPETGRRIPPHQAVSDDDETDDAVVSGRSASPVPAQRRAVSRR